MTTMTVEQDFAWLRSKAPSARDIEIFDDRISRERVVRLSGAEPQDVERVRVALGLRGPFIRWRVEA